MAKRKSTDKTSKDDAEQKVETDRAPDQSGPSDDTPKDLDIAAEAVEAVEIYAPADETPDAQETNESASGDPDTGGADEVIEQPEPEKETATEASDPPAPETESSDAESESDAGKDSVDDDHLTEEEAERLIEEAESGEYQSLKPDAEETVETAPAEPTVIRETTIERKGGFVPMLLGGVGAAVLGYGVAAYSSQAVWPFENTADTGFETEMRDALSTQDGALTDLGARLASLEGAEAPTVDLSPLESQIAALQSTSDDLSARLDEISTRLDTLERQPLESAVSEEAIAAYERALADLQAEIETQRAEVTQMAQDAVAAEENAEEKARLAASRAALAEITTALDTGAAYPGALSVLSSNGVDIPAALADTADSGVPTQSGLVEAFPAAARAALSAARTADTEGAEGVGRLTTFFANQLGARSVAPKEGDDADAVLSRAEAAVRSGDLSDALAELSGLPDVAQSAVADWRSSAETRLAAKSAADALVQQLLQE